MYNEFWQGMANQYQELPEDRVYRSGLPLSMLRFWQEFNFDNIYTGTINGIVLNTMFKVRKIEGKIDPTDYLCDSHMYEVEGKYSMKKRVYVDAKRAKKIILDRKAKLLGTLLINFRV